MNAGAVVCLLRGINVGGRNKQSMATLRSIADGLGAGGSTTYLQSGNLVLHDAPPGVDVAGALAEAITAETGLRIAVITRTAGEWAAVMEANPFPEASPGGTKLHVAFFDQPIADGLDGFDATPFAPDALGVAPGRSPREIYLSLPNGIGRSKLAEVLYRGPAAAATVRNWNTVTAIARLIT